MCSCVRMHVREYVSLHVCMCAFFVYIQLQAYLLTRSSRTSRAVAVTVRRQTNIQYKSWAAFCEKHCFAKNTAHKSQALTPSTAMCLLALKMAGAFKNSSRPLPPSVSASVTQALPRPPDACAKPYEYPK